MAIVFDSFWGYIGIFISLMVANVLFGVAAYGWGKIMLSQEILVRA